MGLEREYGLRCDNCFEIHSMGYSTPRRARAAAKRDGWARRNMGEMLPFSDGSGYFQAWGPWRDYCAICIDRMDKEQETTNDEHTVAP